MRKPAPSPATWNDPTPVMRSSSFPLARSTIASAAFGISSAFSLSAFAFSITALVGVSGKSTRLLSRRTFGAVAALYPRPVRLPSRKERFNRQGRFPWRGRLYHGCVCEEGRDPAPNPLPQGERGRKKAILFFLPSPLGGGGWGWGSEDH